MKKIVLIILLLPNFIQAASEQSDIDHNNTNPHEIIMTEEDLNNLRADLIPPKPNSTWTKPLIIDANNHDFDTMSVLRLENNIVYNPGQRYVYPSAYSDYPAAIIIAKDNMTIDLNGFNLSLDPSSAANFLTNNPTYGIAVYQGVKNVKIISSGPITRKGSISGFSGFAIYITGTIQNYNTYDIYSNFVKNIIIDNLLITQNINGIYILNALAATISNTNIIYNFSSRIVFGILYVNVLEGLIDSCKINQNFSFGDIFGVCLQDTNNVTVQNSEANYNRSFQSGNATGMIITATAAGLLSASNKISNCLANRNLCSFVNGKKSVGFNINNLSHHNAIENCSSFLCNHVPGIGSATTQGIGFQIDNAGLNQIHNNRSGYHETYGFSDTATISTSFWTSNSGLFNNITNYNVTVPTHTGSAPLSTIIVTPNDLSAYLNAGPVLANISAQLP
jgi:hypothetical protein